MVANVMPGSKHFQTLSFDESAPTVVSVQSQHKAVTDGSYSLSRPLWLASPDWPAATPCAVRVLSVCSLSTCSLHVLFTRALSTCSIYVLYTRALSTCSIHVHVQTTKTRAADSL